MWCYAMLSFCFATYVQITPNTCSWTDQTLEDQSSSMPHLLMWDLTCMQPLQIEVAGITNTIITTCSLNHTSYLCWHLYLICTLPIGLPCTPCLHSCPVTHAVYCEWLLDSHFWEAGADCPPPLSAGGGLSGQQLLCHPQHLWYIHLPVSLCSVCVNSTEASITACVHAITACVHAITACVHVCVVTTSYH